MYYLLLTSVFLSSSAFAQNFEVFDDFEGNGTIFEWFGDDCGADVNVANPFVQGINQSPTVFEYGDNGGQYANVRFTLSETLDMATYHTFSLKIYIPSSGVTGSQNNQVSLKLQDASLGQPWTTQTEITKNVVLDQWQEVTFNFDTDPFINFDVNSPDPITRTDLNRVLIQVNGENNNDLVTAYIDDFNYDGWIGSCSDYNVLVWSDEFDVDGAIDGSKWFHQTQLPNGTSWYNGELQHYTDRIENSYVQNGHLYIVAKDETFTDQNVTKEYTSARLNSKFAFTYGRIEVKAKLPTGDGTWPAIWMLGKNINEPGAYWQTQGFGTTSWPDCGEIDIMEHWGTNQDFTQSALHTPSSFGNTVNHGGTMGNEVSDVFHTYAAEWTPTEIRFYYDNYHVYTYAPQPQNMSTWPFIADQYLILNIAIISSIQPSFTESPMVIDYVRIYQDGNHVDTQTACEDYTWIDGNTYTQSTTTPTFTLSDQYGCDSIVQLDLTIGGVNTNVNATAETTLEAEVTGVSYQWIDCQNNFMSINGATNQSYTGQLGGAYAVIISDGNCSDTSECITLNSSHLDDHGLNTIEVYPNPARDYLKIEHQLSEGTFEIFDASGRTIRKGPLQTNLTEIDLGEIEKGKYFVQIDNQRFPFVVH